MHQGQMVKLDFSMEWGSMAQGVCIRPLFFLIFINDLDENINSKILNFADDTKTFKEFRNSTDCSQLQADQGAD